MALRCQQTVVEQTNTVPAPLMVPQQIPAWQKGGTVRDALHYAVDSNAAARMCEADRAKIKKTQRGEDHEEGASSP